LMLLLMVENGGNGCCCCCLWVVDHWEDRSLVYSGGVVFGREDGETNALQSSRDPLVHIQKVRLVEAGEDALKVGISYWKFAIDMLFFLPKYVR
jgi:hypothetical protein